MMNGTLSRISEENITNGVRVLHSGGEAYDKYFTGTVAADERDKMVSPDGEVEDTLRVMEQVVHTYIDDTKAIAQTLKRPTVDATCRAIWEFLYYDIQYKNDVKGIEQLRRPSRSWADRLSGVDCDDFAMFASSILTNLQIPHSFRIAAYEGGFWQHVYVVVPKEGGNLNTPGEYWTIDPVLSAADHEKPPSKKKDFKVTVKPSLSGMEIDILSGIDDEETLGRVRRMFGRQRMPQAMRPVPAVSPAMLAVQRADDLAHAVFGPRLEGLGTAASDTEIDSRYYAWLVATRNSVASNPAIVMLTGEDPEVFLKMLDYAIVHWHTEHRDQALAVLAGNEAMANHLNGYADTSGIEGFEDDSLYGDDEMFLNGFDGLGKLFGKKKDSGAKPKKKGLFKKIGSAVKKVGAAVKKVAKVVLVKANPLVIAARAGLLLAMKLNIGKMAAKLKWAYATPQQAAAAHISADMVNRAKHALEQTEKLFVDKLGGKHDALRNAILKSKGGKLSGFAGLGDVAESDNYLGSLAEHGLTLHGLGFLPAAGLAAAIPVIMKIVAILKSSGLIGKNEKVDPQADISAASGESGDATGDTPPAYSSTGDDSGNYDTPDSLAPETQPTVAQDGDDDGSSLTQAVADSTEDLSGLGSIDGITDMVGSFVKGNPVIAGGLVAGVGLLIWHFAGSSSSGSSRAPASAGLGSAASKKRTPAKKAPAAGKKAKPKKIVLH